MDTKGKRLLKERVRDRNEKNAAPISNLLNLY